MNRIILTGLSVFSSYGWAQQLAAVQPPSDHTGTVLVIGVLGIVGLIGYLKLKKPDVLDSLLSVGKKAFEQVPRKAPPVQPTVTVVEPVPTLSQNDALAAQVAQLTARLNAITAFQAPAPLPTPPVYVPVNVAPQPAPVPVIPTYVPHPDPRFPDWDGIPNHPGDPWISHPGAVSGAITPSPVRIAPQPVPEVPLPVIEVPVRVPVLGDVGVQRYEWVWAQPSPIYTFKMGGGIGNGIVTIGFTVPSDAINGWIGNISIAPYGSNPDGTVIGACAREISISPLEGDFSQPFPWTRKGDDPGMQFIVGASTRFAPGLTPGQRYWINIRSFPVDGAKADMVIQCSRPRGRA